VAATCARDPGEGSAVTVMVRPERVRLDGTTPIGSTLAGRIEAVAFLGAASVVHVRLADGASFEVRVAGADAAPHILAAGDAIRIGWNAADAVVLEG
jgi:ABC-type Fe3+/spermidine/putrescine transport system ATPase subunit